MADSTDDEKRARIDKPVAISTKPNAMLVPCTPSKPYNQLESGPFSTKPEMACAS